MITIRINGETTRRPAGITLATLLDDLALQNKRLAVEINQEIIPRSRFDEHVIQEHDQIEIVQAIGGG